MPHPLHRALAVAVSVAWAATAVPVPAVPEWTWPTSPVQVVRPYVAPAHAYGPGHRGVDLAATGAVRSPADGVVAFGGTVVDRGVLTIDHGDGLVTTFEPVETERRPGDPVARGEEVALVSAGGHAEPGTVHFGVRLHGEYINPLALLGGVPRAVLLPCC
jgi:murein DD-endopeptidase MepM/ murein hydrolase activator NlpD